ncbi:major facilitator superfamily domain-containing protein [Talaromyces proteolyticus]|uniref:Major facilitator superfamily domain-containing protein n=1 Tax=Talaromyces proteolyticus TaxID=1131652 RepID=A0AAD4L0C9_9EURO|nr:major facilitator superfamily domain-containing protein [Talaromyces proteolyticus]KAH8705243.1 major facilitator superfamily domain-containing protein [Talaromyces proteolyticus]
MTLSEESNMDETTPLIAAPETHTTVQQNGANIDKPLPMGQILLLCFARIVEPIAFFSIFPFMNRMIEECGDVPETDVGFYSGFIESLFSLTQMMLMLPWGRASDRFGRKPVLVISLAGLSVTCALFGTSQKIWQMIVYRCLAGVFSGTVVTVRTAISENSTPKTQARAFSYFALFSNLGICVGPLLGGVLLRPAEQYPSLFGNVRFFKDYPYALPTFATGSIAATACIVSALFVKETLRSKIDGRNEPVKPMSTTEIIRSPGVSLVLFLNAFTILITLGYTAIIPVFYFTNPKFGGYGFREIQISAFMGIGGLSQAAWLIFVFPSLQRRIGTGGVLRACSVCLPFWFFLTPAANIFLRVGWETVFWVYAPVVVVVGSGVAMGFTAFQLALNDISPSSETLGTLNAISLTLTSAIRSIAPGLFASLFATGVKHQILAGYFAWVILIALAIVQRASLRWLPTRVEGKIDVVNEDEEIAA